MKISKKEDIICEWDAINDIFHKAIQKQGLSKEQIQKTTKQIKLEMCKRLLNKETETIVIDPQSEYKNIIEKDAIKSIKNCIEIYDNDLRDLAK